MRSSFREIIELVWLPVFYGHRMILSEFDREMIFVVVEVRGVHFGSVLVAGIDRPERNM